MNVMGTPILLVAIGLPVAVTIFLIVTRIGLIKGLLGGGRPKFGGPALAGTARVFSVQPTGSSIQRGGLPPQYQCRIVLRVEVPGRPAYDVTTHQLVDSMVLPNTRQGSNVAVQVDSVDPQNIYVDFGQPIAPAA